MLSMMLAAIITHCTHSCKVAVLMLFTLSSQNSHCDSCLHLFPAGQVSVLNLWPGASCRTIHC